MAERSTAIPVQPLGAAPQAQPPAQPFGRMVQGTGRTPEPGLVAQWQTFFSSPAGRAAALQFAVNLMQPRFGGNPLSNIASAVGAGAEAAGRVETQRQERENKAAQFGLERERVDISRGQLDAEREATRQRAAASAAQIAAQRDIAKAEEEGRNVRAADEEAGRNTRFDKQMSTQVSLAEKQIKAEFDLAITNNDRQLLTALFAVKQAEIENATELGVAAPAVDLTAAVVRDFGMIKGLTAVPNKQGALVGGGSDGASDVSFYKAILLTSPDSARPGIVRNWVNSGLITAEQGAALLQTPTAGAAPAAQSGTSAPAAGGTATGAPTTTAARRPASVRPTAAAVPPSKLASGAPSPHLTPGALTNVASEKLPPLTEDQRRRVYNSYGGARRNAIGRAAVNPGSERRVMTWEEFNAQSDPWIYAFLRDHLNVIGGFAPEPVAPGAATTP